MKCKIIEKAIVTTIAFSLTALASYAVVAWPEKRVVTQPDGSQLEILAHGDEFSHYITTIDGFTIVRTDGGAWHYAILEGGKLVPTDVKASTPAMRDVEEQEFIKTLPLGIAPELTSQMASRREDLNGWKPLLKQPKNASRAQRYDYTNFRGLILLVEFNDIQFGMSDPAAFFTEMVTKRGYTGFQPEKEGEPFREYTGSVRDYFIDSSNGLFDPHFDIVGPIRIDYPATYVHSTDNIGDINKAALLAADKYVDFSDYDTDGDGLVDMFYVIFAGGGSNFPDNPDEFVWPHAWTMEKAVKGGMELDGVKLGRYACSVELFGNYLDGVAAGIGTICHEFSHVLGLKDHYDADGTGSGGRSVGPGYWSLMASASYLNEERTPLSLSLLERWQAGFAEPEIIDEAGSFSLHAIGSSNHGYLVESQLKDEFFLLENRSHSYKWDAYAPGEGMLVFRVDQTDMSAWDNNKVNTDPSNNHYELIRANAQSDEYGIFDSDGDTFPGSGFVTELGTFTQPGLLTHGSLSAAFDIKNIRMDDKGTIVFETIDNSLGNLVEGFENMSTTTNYDEDVEGEFCSWSFYKSFVTLPPAEWCDGNKGVAVVKDSEIETSQINEKVHGLSFFLHNPSASTITMEISMSVGDDDTWTPLKLTSGEDLFSVLPGMSSRALFIIDNEDPIKILISTLRGHATQTAYIDNFTLSVSPDESEASIIAIETPNLQPGVNVSDNFVIVSNLPEGSDVRLFNLSGQTVSTAKSDTLGIALLPKPTKKGFYILNSGSFSMKFFAN